MPTDNYGAQLDELIRLANESVVLQPLPLRHTFDNKGDLITALSRAGFGNARLGGLLGDTTASIRSAVNRAKKNSG